MDYHQAFIFKRMFEINLTKNTPIIHLQFLAYLPHIQLRFRRMRGEDLVSLSPEIMEEGLQKLKKMDYIEAEDNFILAIVTITTKPDEELSRELLTIRYKAAFQLIKCGIHLGHLFLMQRFTEVFVSLPKVAGVGVDESELVACINSSGLHTRRRRSALEWLHCQKLCLGVNDVQPNGPPDEVPLLLPAAAIPVIRELYKRGIDLFHKGEIREALEFFRDVTTAHAEAMKWGIQLPGFGPGLEFNILPFSFKCMILLGDFRRIEHIFRDGINDVPISDGEMKETMKRSKASLLKRRSVLAVLQNFKHCLGMTEAELIDPVRDVAAANTLYKDGEYQQALDLYTLVLDQVGVSYPKRDLSLIHYNRGSAFLQLSRSEEAEKDFEKVLEINPQHEKAKAKLAIAEKDTNLIGKSDLSKKEAGHASSIAAVAKAHAVFEKGSFSEAITLYTEVLERVGKEYPKNELAAIYFNRGSCATELRMWRDAMDDYERVLRIDPGHSQAKGHFLVSQLKDAEENRYTEARPAKPRKVAADTNLPDTFSRLPHIPSLAHYRPYLDEADSETSLNNANSLVDEGLKCYSAEDYIEAEDKFMLAVAICEKFSSEGFKEKSVCRTAASWLLKCGLLTGNSYVVKFYAEYLVSLPTVTSASIPFIDATFVDVINVSVVNTSRRVVMLEQLQQYGLCTNKRREDIQIRGETSLYFVDDDPQIICRMCHELMDEGKRHLDRIELVEALDAFRAARDCMLNSCLPRGGTMVFTSCADLETPIVTSILKCLILLGDFRRISVRLKLGRTNPFDDVTVTKLLRESKAPAHRKAAVLVVLHEFGSCLKVTEKDLYDPAPDVATANSLYREDKFQEAVDVYNEVLNRIGPVYPERELSLVYYNRGSALLQLARQDFEKTVKLNPDHEKAKKKLNQIQDSTVKF